MPLHARITTLAAVVYAPLALIALVWARLADDRLPWSFDTPWLDAPYPARLLLSLALGFGLAITVVLLTQRLVARTRWARDLHRELKAILEGISSREIKWLALSSGVAEELFFRGAMQPTLGLLVTSIIFGAVHIGPRRVFLAWTTWAFVMGLLLGLIFELTGVLWGSVLAHVWINQRNMTFIQSHY